MPCHRTLDALHPMKDWMGKNMHGFFGEPTGESVVKLPKKSPILFGAAVLAGRAGLTPMVEEAKKHHDISVNFQKIGVDKIRVI